MMWRRYSLGIGELARKRQDGGVDCRSIELQEYDHQSDVAVMTELQYKNCSLRISFTAILSEMLKAPSAKREYAARRYPVAA